MAHPATSRRTAKLAVLCFLALAFVSLGVAWRWTPLGEDLQPASLLDALRGLEELPFAPVAVLAGYVIAGLCVVPITLLVIVTAMAFDPLPAAGYAIVGSLLSAAVTFLIGAWLGRDAVRRLAGERINRISRRFAAGGVLAIATLRLLPLAPFTVVNLVAGASQMRLVHFMTGTFLAEAPGIVLIVALVHSFAGAVREPSVGAFAALTVVLLLIIGCAYAVKRRLRKRGA